MCRNIKVVDICKCRPSENIVDIPFMDKFSSLPVCSLGTSIIIYKLTLNLKVERTIEYLIKYNLFILPIKLYGRFEGFDKYVHIER